MLWSFSRDLGEDLAVEGYSFAAMLFPIGDILGGLILGKMQSYEVNIHFIVG